MTEPLRHPTAVIDPAARLADDVEVGPYAVIEAGAVLGPGCRVMAHAFVGRGALLGRDNRLFPHAVIGTDSQDLKYRGEEAGLVIGDGNTFREFVTVNRATGPGRSTRIGSGCLFLAYSHVAHNCEIGDRAVLANCAELGGEVQVGRHAILGGLVGVHQFCRIGAYAIVGACSKVTQDIPPFVLADGHPARPRGLNRIGLRRHQFPAETIRRIKQAFARIYRRGERLESALAGLETEYAGTPEVQEMVAFIRASRRQIARPRAAAGDADAGGWEGGD